VVHDPPPAGVVNVALVNVAGMKLSLTTTFWAGSGPSLVMVAVKLTGL
jgi:hypothetical protein